MVLISFFFFFNDTATTEIYTLSLHDALPICGGWRASSESQACARWRGARTGDRKSTRLNSSHSQISYAVFCLKKKNKQTIDSFSTYYSCNTSLCISHLQLAISLYLTTSSTRA